MCVNKSLRVNYWMTRSLATHYLLPNFKPTVKTVSAVLNCCRTTQYNYFMPIWTALNLKLNIFSLYYIVKQFSQLLCRSEFLFLIFKKKLIWSKIRQDKQIPGIFFVYLLVMVCFVCTEKHSLGPLMVLQWKRWPSYLHLRMATLILVTWHI